VGLSGEVRSINQGPLRIREAEKRGFKRCLIPKGNLRELSKKERIKILGLAKIQEALRLTGIS